jgi:hypothetical protein
VLCAPGVAHHAVERAGLGQDLVDGGLDGGFFCDVGGESEELVWVLLREGCKPKQKC